MDASRELKNKGTSNLASSLKTPPPNCLDDFVLIFLSYDSSTFPFRKSRGIF